VTKLLSTLALLACGLVALVAAAPVLARLASALVPLVLVAGIVAAVLRLVWAYTRRW
jgi:hypothetical protein